MFKHSALGLRRPAPAPAPASAPESGPAPLGWGGEGRGGEESEYPKFIHYCCSYPILDKTIINGKTLPLASKKKCLNIFVAVGTLACARLLFCRVGTLACFCF